jgi:anti-sigma regulatory factor (Ser/Thr protein kinase)
MKTFTGSRVIQFSLPADPSALSIVRRFIKEIAGGTTLRAEEVRNLQTTVTTAFNNALSQQRFPGEGRIALRIHAWTDRISVDLVYRETEFPPVEYFSRS